MTILVEKSAQIGQPMILVSMNYRVQGWGFLAGHDVRNEGLLNIGIQDQRLALQWIQDNIEYFGGDRQRVTIQGVSAAAICQSGGPYYFGSFASDAQSEKTYQSILQATNCTNSQDTLQCLRTTPFETFNATFASLSFRPVIDGALTPQPSSVALEKSPFVKVPLLIGANTDEGKFFAGMGVDTTEELAAYIAHQSYVHTANNETIRDVLDVYPEPGSSEFHGQSDDTLSVSPPYGHQFLRTARYNVDAVFIAGRRYACEVWAQNGLPCYSYRFKTIPAHTDPLHLGATHFEDVAFVFNNLPGQGMPSNPFDVEPAARKERYVQLSELMSRMWISFAATHPPNNHRVDSFSTIWPAYDLKSPRNLVFDGNPTSYVESDD